MKSYIGHHTCLQRGGKHYVLAEAPFPSQTIIEEDERGEIEYRHPFLGSGYYFWEFDLDQAKYWGRVHYKLPYFVVQANINTTNENFLDLVGDIQMAGMLQLRASQLVAANLIEADFTLSELIEYLKGANDLEPGLFDYQIIRARDFYPDYRATRVYFNEKDNYTHLTGRHIFCLIVKNEVVLSDKQIVFTS